MLEFVPAPEACIDHDERQIREQMAWQDHLNRHNKPESPCDVSAIASAFPHTAAYEPFADFDLVPLSPGEQNGVDTSVDLSPFRTETTAEKLSGEFVAAGQTGGTGAKSSGADMTFSTNGAPTAAESPTETGNAAESPTENAAESPTDAEARAAAMATTKNNPEFTPYPEFAKQIDRFWGGMCDKFLKKMEVYPHVVQRYNLQALRDNPPLPYKMQGPSKIVFMYNIDGKKIYCHDQNTKGKKEWMWPIVFKGKPTYMSKVIEMYQKKARLKAEEEALGAAAGNQLDSPLVTPSSNSKKRKVAPSVKSDSKSKKRNNELRGIGMTEHFAAARANSIQGEGGRKRTPTDKFGY